jgi:lysophospholipase L1-like esterase
MNWIGPLASLANAATLGVLCAVAYVVLHHWWPPIGRRPPQGLRQRFVFFGDSIIGNAWSECGWLAQLASIYKRTADVTNRGYNGYNSRWALHVLPHLFRDSALSAPSLVGICLGANDAILPPPLAGRSPAASRHHVPIDEYEQNLRAIIAASLATGACVLVMTPPPTDGLAWLAFERRRTKPEPPIREHAESTRSNEATGAYAARAVRVAKEFSGVAAVDLWSAMQERQPRAWGSFFSDGVHPNVEGATVIFELVRDTIATHFPELRPAGSEGGMLFDFPDHCSIDEHDPARSFEQWEERRRTRLAEQ